VGIWLIFSKIFILRSAKY